MAGAAVQLRRGSVRDAAFTTRETHDAQSACFLLFRGPPKWWVFPFFSTHPFGGSSGTCYVGDCIELSDLG